MCLYNKQLRGPKAHAVMEDSNKLTDSCAAVLFSGTRGTSGANDVMHPYGGHLESSVWFPRAARSRISLLCLLNLDVATRDSRWP